MPESVCATCSGEKMFRRSISMLKARDASFSIRRCSCFEDSRRRRAFFDALRAPNTPSSLAFLLSSLETVLGLTPSSSAASF